MTPLCAPYVRGCLSMPQRGWLETKQGHNPLALSAPHCFNTDRSDARRRFRLSGLPHANAKSQHLSYAHSEGHPRTEGTFTGTLVNVGGTFAGALVNVREVLVNMVLCVRQSSSKFTRVRMTARTCFWLTCLTLATRFPESHPCPWW